MPSFVTFILAHLTAFSAFGIALLDFLFALIPGLSGNGLLHQLYVWLTGNKGS